MKPRVRDGLLGRDCRARTSWSRSAQARAGGARSRAMAPATSSAVPTNGLTRRPGAPIARNCAGCRLTAHPATRTSPAVASERRTDWRDLASASLVMQHVLITCRSASCSGTSVCPAPSSARRASHRVSLRDLAAEELDGERRHGGRTLARPPWTPHSQLSRMPAAGGFSCSSCAASCRGVLEPARGARRKDSCANPARGFGRGTTTSRSRPPSVTPIASGLGNWVHLLFQRVLCSEIATSR